MPMTSKSDKWFVRVDGSREFLQQKLDTLAGSLSTKRLLALYHVGDKKENPHVHFVLETTMTQHQSFRDRIKKLFNIEKKSQYSSKEWDGEIPACAYMFHEDNETILKNVGFTDDELEKFREHNKVVQKVVEENKKRASNRCVELCLEYFKKEDVVPERRDIFNQILGYIRDGTIYEPGDWLLQRYVEEVYCKTRTNDNWDDYVEERYRKLFLR